MHTAEEAQAWKAIQLLRNSDIHWFTLGGPKGYAMAMLSLKGSAASGLFSSFGAPALSSFPASDRPLLRALDDKDKYLAASVILWMRQRGPPFDPSITIEDPGIAFDQDPLLTLARPRGLADWPGKKVTAISVADTDPQELMELRDFWHERLDQTIISLNVWWILVIALIPPMIALSKHYHRVHRIRMGRCPLCNYDLRASSGVCPECGSPIPKNDSTPSTV